MKLICVLNCYCPFEYQEFVDLALQELFFQVSRGLVTQVQTSLDGKLNFGFYTFEQIVMILLYCWYWWNKYADMGLKLQ